MAEIEVARTDRQATDLALTLAGSGIRIRFMRTEQATVSEIDRVRRECFGRSPDRPSGRIRARSRQPIELKRAKSKLRTAAWRAALDKKGRPETDTVATQFLVSLIAVARQSGCAVVDLPETRAAFDHLFETMERRGFQRHEVEAVVRRLARRSRDRDAG